MLPVEIDQAVAALAARYDLLLKAIRGDYATATASAHPTSLKTRSAYLKGTTQSTADIEPMMRDGIYVAIDAIVDQAIRDTNVSIGWFDLDLDDAISDLKHDVRLTIERCIAIDIITGLKLLRSAGIDEMLGSAPNNQAPEITFKQTDTAGRKIDSMRYLTLEIRHYLVRLYVDVYLLTAQAAGFDHFEVRSGDELRGEFTIKGDGAVPSYKDVRDKHFHPNTKSFPTIVRLA